MDDHPPGTLIYDLAKAEWHISNALELLYAPSGGVKRGFWYRRGMLKAQGIIMNRLVSELDKEKSMMTKA